MIYRDFSQKDYFIGGGTNEFLQGVEAVAQAIVTRIKLLKEEWWENLDDGTPLWQNILGHSEGNIKLVDEIILKRISGTQGVKDILEYESNFNPSTRGYNFRALVDTNYGSTVIEESL